MIFHFDCLIPQEFYYAVESRIKALGAPWGEAIGITELVRLPISGL